MRPHIFTVTAGREKARMVAAADNQARLDTLKACVAVFYLDHNGIEAMEHLDRRKFEIRHIPNNPGRPELRNSARVAKRGLTRLTVFAGPNGSGKSRVTRQPNSRAGQPA